MTPTVAELALVRCNFIAELKKYTTCKKYNLDCCTDDLLKAYALHKSLNEPCDIDYDLICKTRKLTLEPLTCSGTPTCTDLLGISLRKSLTGGAYTLGLENEVDQTSLPSITLANNSIYQDSELSITVEDSYGNLEAFPFTTGDYYNGVTVTSGDQYRHSFEIRYWLNGVLGTANSYLKTIRLHYYENGVSTPIDLDISPSNIWVCGTCGAPATAGDLYFNATNIASAIQTQIRNAVKSTDGADNISVTVTKELNSDGSYGLYFRFKIKHQPSGKW